MAAVSTDVINDMATGESPSTWGSRLKCIDIVEEFFERAKQ